MNGFRSGLLPVLLVLIGLGGGAAAQAAVRLDRLPLPFVENRGLYPKAVAYFVPGAGKTLFFTPSGVTLLLRGEGPSWTVKLDFPGASAGVRPRGEDPKPAIFSYFRGRPGDWKTGLPTWGRVVYADLWPGIDLVFSGAVNRLKYALVLRPGADAGRIRLRYRGATGVGLTGAGSLRIETPAGFVEDAAPTAFQRIDGRSRAVDVRWALEGDTARFRLGPHDPARPLVIDPAALVYCGYLGGKGPDYGHAVAVDGSGHAYVTGFTMSSAASFPVKVGPSLQLHGAQDAFVAKVNVRGNALVYCGYLGGSGGDIGNGIAVDARGHAYVTGTTTSKDFPVKIGPDLTFNGSSDVFIAKVLPSGTSLAYAGYVGGNRADVGNGVAVDGAGQAVIAGFTDSTEATFPVKGGPTLTHQGSNDGFVAKVNARGSALVYCGYLGGHHLDRATAVAVDAKGHAFVTGFTNSPETSFPVKVGPFLKYHGKYFHDAFVAKLTPAGALVYSGYLGGPGSDVGQGIAVDAAGHAYVVGQTSNKESAFPVKTGPDLTFNGGWYDAFVAKVVPSGRGLAYCGYIGGAGPDAGFAVDVDRHGHAYVVGQTRSDAKTFPVKGGPDLTYNGGMYDAFVARVHASGQGLDYAGYLGGAGHDGSQGIAVDRAGNAYVVGRTDSTEATFPVRVGPDPVHNGGTDAFVAKVSATLTDGVPGTGRPGQPVTLTFTATADAGLHYQAGSSLGLGPIAIDTRRLHLSPDLLLWASLSGALPHTFSGYTGVIGAAGTASGTFRIPDHPAVVGLTVHTAFVTLSRTAPSGVQSIASTFSLTIR